MSDGQGRAGTGPAPSAGHHGGPQPSAVHEVAGGQPGLSKRVRYGASTVSGSSYRPTAIRGAPSGRRAAGRRTESDTEPGSTRRLLDSTRISHRRGYAADANTPAPASSELAPIAAMRCLRPLLAAHALTEARQTPAGAAGREGTHLEGVGVDDRRQLARRQAPRRGVRKAALQRAQRALRGRHERAGRSSGAGCRRRRSGSRAQAGMSARRQPAAASGPGGLWQPPTLQPQRARPPTHPPRQWPSPWPGRTAPRPPLKSPNAPARPPTRPPARPPTSSIVFFAGRS